MVTRRRQHNNGTWAGLQGPRNAPSTGPTLGEARFHRKTGLIYVYGVIPGTERVGWLRWDTRFWGTWRHFPSRTARARDLRKFPRERLGLDTDDPVTFIHAEFE